ncbi:hypothetical protein LguiA_030311 [Lonicera macranthoides]
MSARKLMMEELKSIIEVYPPFQQKLKFLKSIGQGYSISLTRDVTSDSTKETDSTAETRSVGMLNEAASASTFPNQSHNSELTILDDFPKTVGWNLEPGSSPTTVDFHPIQQNLLLDLLLNSNWIVKMMIQSKDESWRSKSEDSSSGRLLHDIEEISKALYLQKNPPKALILPSD